MKPVFLIAGNFLREQRWPVFLLVLWVVVSGFMANLGGLGQDDVAFFVKQQAVYGVAFSAFLAASALYNERRSRRILAVLSKGISRSQYLAGLLGGVMSCVGIYCLAMAAAGSWMWAQAGMRADQLIAAIVVLLVACGLTATVGIFFATFLTPLLATAATALALGAPVFLAHALGPLWRNLLPVYGLMQAVLASSDAWVRGYGTMIGWAFADAVVIWAAASLVFSRRDIAVAVE